MMDDAGRLVNQVSTKDSWSGIPTISTVGITSDLAQIFWVGILDISPGREAGTMTFGQWLKVRRERAELSQEDLARELGCTKNTVYNIESGRNDPQHRIQVRAFEFFGITPPWAIAS